MGSLSNNIFQQARLLVAQADRELAELASRFEEAFPLSSEEKEELRPCPVDAFDRWSVELAPKDTKATFLMTPENSGAWLLEVVERGNEPARLGTFQAGGLGNGARGRLRAARVVTAIGDWMERRSGKGPAMDMETVLVLEANTRVEIKAEAQAKPTAQAAAKQEERLEPIQPRWLDMLPGAQQAVPETALLNAAQKENRQQVSFAIGKIFGY